MKSFIAVLLLAATLCQAIPLDTNNVTSIREACNLVAQGLMDYYAGYKKGGTIGMFTSPYYWWEAGGAWGSMIDYTYYFQNDTYTATIMAAMTNQTGEDNNYIPLNQSTTEGNDDQGFWGIAAIQAAERNFTNPANPDQAWLTLAQAVFNTMQSRWDDDDCGGGLRWQIFQWNSGYDYKNSVSNGCLFQIGARLARYTGNQSYADWAEKVWDWMVDVGFMVEKGLYWADHGGLLQQGEPYYFVNDGASIPNCTQPTELIWSYNFGLFISGAAYMYNFTNDEKWLNRTAALLRGTSIFFIDNEIMYEITCQPYNNCNNDQRSFKAYLSRFLALTAVMAPETAPTIKGWLVDSANAAASSCSGGTDGHTCGLNWNATGWDGFYGLGEQMSALEVMQNLLFDQRPPPYTAANGGSSIGNAAAGYGTTLADQSPLKLNSGDSAGAGVITAVIGVSLIGSAVWLVI